jgi:biopolymer transport protein ExbD
VEEMLASWRKSARFAIDIKSNVFVVVAAVLSAVGVMAQMTVPQPYHGFSTDLPKLRGAISLPHAMREDAMIVTIMRDGAVFFRNDRVSPERLADALRKDVKSGSEKRVYIRADARALYRTVKQVLDAVQQAGLVNVSFLADQRRSR